MEPQDDAGDVKEGAALAGGRGNTHAIEHDPAQGIAGQAGDANLASQRLRDLRHCGGTHRSGQGAGPGQPSQPGAQDHDQDDDKNREAHAAVNGIYSICPISIIFGTDCAIGRLGRLGGLGRFSFAPISRAFPQPRRGIPNNRGGPTLNVSG